MHKKDLAYLDEPKYVLYPNMWIYRTVVFLPVAILIAILPWFISSLLASETGIWHWIFIGFLGLLSYGALRPKGRDWRELINFAADSTGIYLVTHDESVEFIPWEKVGDYYEDSINSGGKVIKGITFEVDVDDETWKQLKPGMNLLGNNYSENGHRKIGISSNLRKTETILQNLDRLRPGS